MEKVHDGFKRERERQAAERNIISIRGGDTYTGLAGESQPF
jgi:hypothetical protein